MRDRPTRTGSFVSFGPSDSSQADGAQWLGLPEGFRRASRPDDDAPNSLLHRNFFTRKYTCGISLAFSPASVIIAATLTHEGAISPYWNRGR